MCMTDPDVVPGRMLLRKSRISNESNVLIIFFFLSFFGIAGALIGHFLLRDYPALTAHLMTFASGGILYLLIQDIIPESKLDNKYLSSIGAIIGFLVGIIGEKLF